MRTQLTNSVPHHRNRKLKTLLSIGGWNFGTLRWVCAARSSLWGGVEVMDGSGEQASFTLIISCLLGERITKWLFAFQICKKKARMKALVTYCISPRWSWEMISWGWWSGNGSKPAKVWIWLIIACRTSPKLLKVQLYFKKSTRRRSVKWLKFFQWLKVFQ